MIRLLYRLPSNVAGLNLASLSATPASSEAEARKRDGWAADIEVGLALEIKDMDMDMDMDNQIGAARRAATAAAALEDTLAGQRRVKALEAERNRKRRSLFDAQDEVDRQREALIDAIEGKLTQTAQLGNLFTVRWSLA